MSDRYLHDAVPQQNTSNDLHGSEREQPLPSDPKDQLMQPGLEVAPSSDNDKYFVANRDEEGKEVQEVEHTDEKSHKPLVNPHWQESTRHEPNKSVRLFGMKRTVFWSLLVGALLVVALAIGLGVGLTSRQSDETASTSPASDNASSSAPEPSADPTENRQLHIGGSIDPSYYTTSGAWNGSGTAYIWQNFTQDWDDILSTNEYSHVVYYQHHAGEIRWMRQASDYSWKDGPQDLLVVATDAKNSTPISAVQYTMDGVNYWNVFCKSTVDRNAIDLAKLLLCGVLTALSDLDSENFIRQRSGNNQSTGWTEGSISKAKLAAWNGDLVGLSACESAINGSIPVRLFYASNSTAFEEYLWYAEEDEWVWQKTWNGYSGAAGVGCHPGIGYYRYTGLVNPSNRIEIWYQPTEDIMADWQPGERLLFHP